MTTDPKDAEIARYDLDLMESRMVKDQWGGEWVRHSDHAAEIARLTAALAESEAAAEGAFMILAQTIAERDAALARVAMTVFCTDCESTATRTDDNRCGTCGSGRIMAGKAPPAALSRRDAQMRAEGLRRALDVVSENADWPEDEHGRTEHPALFARISHAILAAAEKEASNG